MTLRERTPASVEAQGFLNIWKFIHDRAGLSFAEERLDILRGQLARRMRDIGVSRYDDYLHRLTFSRNDNEFLQLMNALTINETAFFREPKALRAFQQKIVPELIQAKGADRMIRVWSAGCSTGEEPYTAAIMMRELYETLGPFEFEIVATDISRAALDAAERGRYGAAVVRGMERRYLEPYFVRHADDYEVTRSLRSHVRYQFGNLLDDRLPAEVGPVDVVLCRNVMIYFSQGVRRQVVRRLHSTLQPGGYLILGHNETLHGSTEPFESIYEQGALIYRKSVPTIAGPA